jgi:hypothetical protein
MAKMLNVERVITDAEKQLQQEITPDATLRAAANPPKAISLSSFKKAWPGKIRPAMLTAVSMLRLFGRAKWADYAAQAVAYIDLMIGPEEEPAE